MKKIFVTLLFSVSVISLFAQVPNKKKGGSKDEEDFEGFNVQKEGFSVVIGSLRDAATKEPIEFASVSLLRTRDSSAVKGVITGSNGKFRLEQLPVGNYVPLVTFVGYKKYIGQPFVIKSGSYKTDLGTIDIQPASKNLGEVEVVHNQSVFEMHADKKVFNVDRNLTTVGGTATDVLKNVPSVTVDQNGNVSLRGRSNVTILIDNKPSYLGNDMATVLQQIPANAIESIEVITNPSAKYSAEGTTGIINIVLKKNKLQGYNGVLIGGLGTNPDLTAIKQYNATGTFNFKTEKLNVATTYSFRNAENKSWDENRIDTSLRRVSRILDTNTVSSNMHFGRINADYSLNAFNSVGASFDFFKMQMPIGLRSSNYNYVNNSENTEIYSSRRTLESPGKNYMQSIAPGLNYRHTFLNPKHTLDIDVMTNEFRRFSNTFATDYLVPLNASNLEQNGSDAKVRMYNAQADYSNPLTDDNTLEAGYKYNSFDLDIVNDVLVKRPGSADYVKDSKRSSNTNTKSAENALYVTYSGKIKKMTYKIGLRGENSQKDISIHKFNSSEDSISFSKSYPGLFPSLYLTYNLEKERSIGLNYSRRVERPDFMQILPLTYYSNSKILTKGNPALDPEYIHSMEFNFSKTWDDHSLNFTLYDYFTTNLISDIRIPLAKDTLLSTYKNTGNSNDIGVEVIVKNKIYKWWDITTSINAYRNQLNGTSDLGSKIAYQGNAHVVSAFRPKLDWSKNTSIQFTAFYQTKQTYIQSYEDPVLYFDLGLRKEWGEKKQYILNVSINDIFNQGRTITHSQNGGYDLLNKQYYNSRSVSVSFMYRYGKLDSSFFKKKKAQDNTMDRMGGGF